MSERSWTVGFEQDAERAGVVCVGRVYCDLIFTGLAQMPALGKEIYSDGLALNAGGGAFITAAYLAGLNRPVALAANLPAPPFGAVISEALIAASVESTFCQVLPTATDPQMTVALTHNNDRAFITRRVGDSVPASAADAIAAKPGGHLHIGELATLVEHPELLELAEAADMSISLDCGWDDAVFARNDLASLISRVHIFLPNEDEISQLASCGVDENTAQLTVVKRGPEGARVISREIDETIPTQVVSVLDTTGAGDAFNAGFVNAWLAGTSLRDCVKFGNRCGAIAVGRIGGASGLRREDLLDGAPAMDNTLKAAHSGTI